MTTLVWHKTESLDLQDVEDLFLEITIKNNSNEKRTAYLFGGNLDIVNHEDITIEFSTCSHNLIRKESVINPFWVHEFNVYFSEKENIEEIGYIKKYSIFKKEPESAQVRYKSWMTETNYTLQDNGFWKVIMKEFAYEINGLTVYEQSMPPKSEMKIKCKVAGTLTRSTFCSPIGR